MIIDNVQEKVLINYLVHNNHTVTFVWSEDNDVLVISNVFQDVMIFEVGWRRTVRSHIALCQVYQFVLEVMVAFLVFGFGSHVEVYVFKGGEDVCFVQFCWFNREIQAVFQ